MATHFLKTKENYYADILSGRKKFELRNNDRNFQLGDTVFLLQTVNDKLTGQMLGPLVINYILNGFSTGIITLPNVILPSGCDWIIFCWNVSGWQDFEKQNPEYMQCCIIANQYGSVHEAQYTGEANLFIVGNERYEAQAWMPLPAFR